MQSMVNSTGEHLPGDTLSEQPQKITKREGTGPITKSSLIHKCMDLHLSSIAIPVTLALYYAVRRNASFFVGGGKDYRDHLEFTQAFNSKHSHTNHLKKAMAKDMPLGNKAMSCEQCMVFLWCVQPCRCC